MTIGTRFLSKDTYRFCMDGQYSGLVITGFGEEELFPSVVSLHIRGTLEGALICQEVDKLSCSMGFAKSGAIIPFAQRDVIDMFMYGIKPDYIEEITTRLDKDCFDSFTESVDSTEQLVKRTRPVRDFRDTLIENSSHIFSGIAGKFAASIQKDRKDADKDWQRLISVLPSSELAEMAKTLVRFTCFYRKYGGEEATVKEPVDVAVISKNEGFRWLERKEAYPRHLNPDAFCGARINLVEQGSHDATSDSQHCTS